jgi:hypothetical protein
MLAACGKDGDLSSALDGGIGRSVTEPAASPRPIAWTDVLTAVEGNDTLVPLPRSLCWSGPEILVADGARQRIEAFDAGGRHLRGFGREGSGPGEFRRLDVVRCSRDGESVLAVDPAKMRVQFFGRDGYYRGAAPAPPTPQGVPYLGEFALHDDGRWFDSWLGAILGPYFTSDEWKRVKVVRSWAADGAAQGEFGKPFPFQDPVLHRVFNKVYLTLHRDTLWALSQGPAVIRSFALGGGSEGSRIFLPVYHRGEEPWIEVEGGGPGFRHNRAVYQPNVSGIAVVFDTLFATIRYRNWRMVYVERRKGEGFKDYWPESSVEVFDRKGRVAAAYSVPGRVSAIASDNAHRVPVISEDLDTGVQSILLAGLPSPRVVEQTTVAARPYDARPGS